MVAGTYPLDEIHAAQQAFAAKSHIGSLVITVAAGRRGWARPRVSGLGSRQLPLAWLRARLMKVAAWPLVTRSSGQKRSGPTPQPVVIPAAAMASMPAA